MTEEFNPIDALSNLGEGIAIPQPVHVGPKFDSLDAIEAEVAKLLPNETLRVAFSDFAYSMLDLVAPLRNPAYPGFITYYGNRPGESLIEQDLPQPAKPAFTVDVGVVAMNNVSTGINPKDLIGATKVNPALVPPAAILHTATAMMDGATKYGPYNWRDNAVKSDVYIGAAQRHVMQYLDGEDFDPISGVHHLAHASACFAILLDAMETGNLVDTRPRAGAAGDIIRRFNADTKLR